MVSLLSALSYDVLYDVLAVLDIRSFKLMCARLNDVCSPLPHHDLCVLATAWSCITLTLPLY